MSLAKRAFKRALKHVKPIEPICKNICEFMKFVPPGHFYSPIPSAADCETAFRVLNPNPAGIDLREEAQLRLVEQMSTYYGSIPDFTYHECDRHRYSYDNYYYSYSDATILACFLQKLRPRRFVDIGGGYTSLLVLDLNDTVFSADPIEIDVVEPYPNLLRGMLRQHDRITIVPEKVQSVDLSFFGKLERDDVLFLDTTHVSKLGSEVNYLAFNVLPALKPGVVLHIHEMFFPFEYPREFFAQRKCWNEIYCWRAFLTNNLEYQIELFNSYLEQNPRARMRERFPRYFEQGNPELAVQTRGSSLWLRKAEAGDMLQKSRSSLRPPRSTAWGTRHQVCLRELPCARPPPNRPAARAASQSQLQPPGYPDSIQKRPVVTHDDQTPRPSCKRPFERGDASQVELVRRFVEEQELRRWVTQEQAKERCSCALARAERAQGALRQCQREAMSQEPLGYLRWAARAGGGKDAGQQALFRQPVVRMLGNVADAG